MVDMLIKKALAIVRTKFEKKREELRWKECRALGMHIGNNVILPMSTWIDISHCYLISIGDKCVLGANCVLLAHDALADQFLDAGKIGKVVLHDSCCLGHGTIVLPGVEIGPRVITAAGSIISTTVPPDCVVAGNPAQVVEKLSDFLRFQKLCIKKYPTFPFSEFGMDNLALQKREELLKKLKDSNAPFGYMIGGYSSKNKAGNSDVKESGHAQSNRPLL